MTEPRLAAGVEASALLRLAETYGGFGTILKKGDAQRGALLVVLAERGLLSTVLARQFDGTRYAWTIVPADIDSPKLRLFLEKRARNDPDEWQIELDVPFAQRLVAGMIEAG